MRLLRPRRKVLPSLLGLVVAFAGAGLLSACGSADESHSDSRRPESLAEPERVISLVPALTEMTYALGQEHRLVGVSHYCKFPPEAAEKPKVGALINADYEHVLSLQPDCMILRPEQEEVARRLATYGIDSIRLELQSIEDIRAAVTRLGNLYGVPERADEVIAGIKSDLAEAKAAARRAFADPADPAAEPWIPTVLFIVGRNPGTLQQIYAAGTGSFVEELVEAAGGTNVLEDTAIQWPVIGKETILALDPDVIIDGSFMAESTPEDEETLLVPWQQLSALRAVREGRVVGMRDDHLLIPGPSVGEAAARLGEVIRRAFPERTWTGAETGGKAARPASPQAPVSPEASAP